jgi:hypothetical protein
MGGFSASKISLPSVAITATNSLVEVGNRLARSSLVETPSIYYWRKSYSSAARKSLKCLQACLQVPVAVPNSKIARANALWMPELSNLWFV